MMASFLTRAITIVVGYAYPAYECFKSVEKNRPDVPQLRFWCQYWMIIAVLTIFERLGDTFISWLPMYCEAKLAFIVYLWYPKTRGTTYVYSSFLKPFVANHELEIDRNLNELKTRAGDLAFHYWQRGSLLVQSRFMELLKYVASQSPSSAPQQGLNTSQFQPPPDTPGHQWPSSGYQPQQMASSSTTGFQPSAPELPTGYPLQAPPSAAYYQPQPTVLPCYPQQLPGMHQQYGYANEEEVPYDVMDVVEPPLVTEPVVNMRAQSTYMTRSRQRSHRQK